MFHDNLLKEWISRPGATSDLMWARRVGEEEELQEQYFPTVGSKASCPSVEHLSSRQQGELLQIVSGGLFREEVDENDEDDGDSPQHQADVSGANPPDFIEGPCEANPCIEAGGPVNVGDGCYCAITQRMV